MKPRKIKRLRSIISDKYYLVQRRDYLRQESVLWWREFKETNDPQALKRALAFCRKENWYIRRAGR